MNILALDLSTTVIGYSIFDTDTDELVHMDFFKYQEEELVDRGFEIMVLVQKMMDEYGIKEVAIEERLKKFSQGRTNASAMFNTAQINYVSQFICKLLGLEITEINVMNARGRCFPGFHKIARATKDQKHKEIAFDMVRGVLGDGVFPKKILKSGPRKGEEVFLDEAMDMADSYVIGKAYLHLKKELNEKIRTGVPAGQKKSSGANKKTKA